MTAPAVVRRWSDGPPGRAGDRTGAAARGPVPGPGRRAVEGDRPDALGSVLRDLAVRVRRVAPLGAVLLTALVVHAGAEPHLAVRGAAPDGLLVGVAAVAAGRGPRAGAAFGFAAGLGADLFLATPMGTSALAFTLVGHVLGQSSRPRSSGSAGVLCGPGSTCFACRAGRRHGAEPTGGPSGGRTVSPRPGRREPPATVRPARVRRRAAARRSAVRRSVVLTVLGVAAGRWTTAVVATALGGVPFPGAPGLFRMAAVAAVSAPLGPPAFAAVRRLGRPSGGGRR